MRVVCDLIQAQVSLSQLLMASLSDVESILMLYKMCIIKLTLSPTADTFTLLKQGLDLLSSPNWNLVLLSTVLYSLSLLRFSRFK